METLGTGKLLKPKGRQGSGICRLLLAAVRWVKQGAGCSSVCLCSEQSGCLKPPNLLCPELLSLLPFTRPASPLALNIHLSCPRVPAPTPAAKKRGESSAPGPVSPPGCFFLQRLQKRLQERPLSRQHSPSLKQLRGRGREGRRVALITITLR